MSAGQAGKESSGCHYPRPDGGGAPAGHQHKKQNTQDARAETEIPRQKGKEFHKPVGNDGYVVAGESHDVDGASVNETLPELPAHGSPLSQDKAAQKKRFRRAYGKVRLRQKFFFGGKERAFYFIAVTSRKYFYLRIGNHIINAIFAQIINVIKILALVGDKILRFF